ncbi:Protein CBG17142, partial [Caenorhabditis briggsae]
RNENRIGSFKKINGNRYPTSIQKDVWESIGGKRRLNTNGCYLRVYIGRVGGRVFTAVFIKKHMNAKDMKDNVTQTLDEDFDVEGVDNETGMVLSKKGSLEEVKEKNGLLAGT